MRFEAVGTRVSIRVAGREACSHQDGEHIRQERLHWLKSHREEYAGQYAALDVVVLVGHGRTIREAHEQARQNGVENPFLVRPTSESDALFAGW
jgi:hypothetical protein